MSTAQKPFVWQMIKEAAQALGSPTTNVAVRDWILQRYPGTNKSTIGAQIVVCTVNHDSRIHYPENRKPRTANGQYDFLFRTGPGKLEWYDAARHGSWEIAKDEDGGLIVREVGDDRSVVPAPGQAEPIEQEGDHGHAFAAENHLRDYFAQHLDLLEKELRLYVSDDGTTGVEYITTVGRIDILAVDANDQFVIIELKVSKGPDSVCGQLMRYMGWVKRHLANGKAVRGFIIAQHISDKIRYAVLDLPHVFLKEYELSLTLRDAGQIENEPI